MFATGGTATTPIRDGAVYTPDPSVIAAVQKLRNHPDIREMFGERCRHQWRRHEVPFSLRAFDGKGMMKAADVVPGTAIENMIAEMFANDATEYLHVHYAKPGCYAARVDRA